MLHQSLNFKRFLTTIDQLNFKSYAIRSSIVRKHGQSN